MTASAPIVEGRTRSHTNGPDSDPTASVLKLGAVVSVIQSGLFVVIGIAALALGVDRLVDNGFASLRFADPTAFRVLCVAFLLIAVLGLAITAAEHGVADNNKLETHGVFPNHFNYFGNVYFKALHVVNVRRTVPWDTVRQAASGDPEAQAELADVKTWVAKVKALSKNTGQPTVSFDRCPEGKKVVNPANPGGALISCDDPPSVEQYRVAVKEFLADPTLGQVKYFTAWNEPNRPPSKKNGQGRRADLEQRGTRREVLACARRTLQAPSAENASPLPGRSRRLP